MPNLANQTANATEEISGHITGIQNASQEAAGAIEGIGRTIGNKPLLTTQPASGL